MHGRELVLPTTQSITAKLSPEVRGTSYEGPLENLKSGLKMAYKTVRQNIDKSYRANKQYYDRKAKEREFEADDIVYLFNPATKPGRCAKFRKYWHGPFKILQKVSKLDYRVISMQGRESVIHQNRIKRARNPQVWKPREKRPTSKRARPNLEDSREEEQEMRASGPIEVQIPQGDCAQRDPASPNSDSPRQCDTPPVSPLTRDTPGSERADPSYRPEDTPRSRRELNTTRAEPPLTRFRARLQPLSEVAEEQ
jgi:hypothetical protein